MVDIDYLLMKLRHLRPEEKLLEIDSMNKFLNPEEFNFIYEVVKKYGKKYLADST